MHKTIFSILTLLFFAGNVFAQSSTSDTISIDSKDMGDVFHDIFHKPHAAKQDTASKKIQVSFIPAAGY